MAAFNFYIFFKLIELKAWEQNFVCQGCVKFTGLQLYIQNCVWPYVVKAANNRCIHIYIQRSVTGNATIFALAISCAAYKRVTDDEGSRLQLILRKLSEEWPLLNSITRDEHGSSLADVTYGGYVIICTGLLAGQIAGELRYPVMECFFLGIGVLLYSILGGLELASIELLRNELVDNAAILGGLSLIMALVFIFDLITGPKRRKRQQVKIEHYWKGVTKPSVSISTSTRGTQTDSDMEDEDEIISIASLPLPPAPLDVATKLPRSQLKSHSNGRPSVHWEEGSEKGMKIPSSERPLIHTSATPSPTRTHSSLAPLSPGYVQQTVQHWPSPTPCPSLNSQPPSPSLSSYPSTPLPQDHGALEQTSQTESKLRSEAVKSEETEVPTQSLRKWLKNRQPKDDKNKMDPV